MLRVENISKSFSGVNALYNISLLFEGGKVHVLCGENGAGKSTLMHIISGNLLPDSGTIYWMNEPVTITTVPDAQRKGIAIVHQERSLVDSLSIAENIFPQNAPRTKWGLIDYGKLYLQTNALLTTLGMKALSAKTLVGSLSSAQKQLVEIAKALAANPSLLILDEPTASLTHTETVILFTIIEQLKNKGAAVIYITHRMAEIEQIGDVVSVLKDGRYQGTKIVKETTSDELVRMMVGRELHQKEYPSHAKTEIRLKAENLSGAQFSGVSFDVRAGEVFGFAGLEGSGRTALARALFGDLSVREGSIQKDGHVVAFTHPADALQNGFAYLPDDRKGSGLFVDKTVAENITASCLQKGFYNEQRNDAVSMDYVAQLQIKTQGTRQVVRKLSGGNQQKIVLAKWLLTNPDILIMNEPTHGVDVGAKGEIYAMINTLAQKGKSILLISSDLPELLLLSDQIAVMYAGRLQGILGREEATEERITALASGIKH